MRKFPGYEKGVDFGGWLSQCSEYTKEHYEELNKDNYFFISGIGGICGATPGIGGI